MVVMPMRMVMIVIAMIVRVDVIGAHFAAVIGHHAGHVLKLNGGVVNA